MSADSGGTLVDVNEFASLDAPPAVNVAHHRTWRWKSSDEACREPGPLF